MKRNSLHVVIINKYLQLIINIVVLRSFTIKVYFVQATSDQSLTLARKRQHQQHELTKINPVGAAEIAVMQGDTDGDRKCAVIHTCIVELK